VKLDAIKTAMVRASQLLEALTENADTTPIHSS
jgi:hypothetical protein